MVKDRPEGPAAGGAEAAFATGPRAGAGAAAVGEAAPEAGAAGVTGAAAGGAEGGAAVASRAGSRFAVSLILSVIALAAFSAGEFRHTSPSVAAMTSSELVPSLWRAAA